MKMSRSVNPSKSQITYSTALPNGDNSSERFKEERSFYFFYFNAAEAPGIILGHRFKNCLKINPKGICLGRRDEVFSRT